MAFGMRCIECGAQETEHQYSDEYGTCECYVSPDPDVEAAMWRADRMQESDRAAKRRRASGIPDDL